MPTIRQSQKVNRDRLEPIPESAQALPIVLPPQDIQAVSPFMSSSLPPRAAGLDQFQRQFYGRGTPQQRILQPNLE
jgi:hypothetical protein